MDNDLGKAFNNPLTIRGFSDGKERNLYQFKMKEAKYFFDLMKKIDINNLLVNYLIDEDGVHLKEFFNFCFQEDKIEDFEENINVGNFKAIMKQIFDELGIEFDDEKKTKRE